jgi:5-methyltetrahydrofolate--homocysteine methyltransferase
LAHPDATYFNVGKIGDDQVKDLAQRSGVDEQRVRLFLGPNL